jgi:hypothetical protein
MSVLYFLLKDLPQLLFIPSLYAEILNIVVTFFKHFCVCSCSCLEQIFAYQICTNYLIYYFYLFVFNFTQLFILFEFICIFIHHHIQLDMNAAHVSWFDTHSNFPLRRGKHALLAGNSHSSQLQTTRVVFKPDSRRKLFWFIPEAADLILIGPAWSHDFFVLRCVLEATLPTRAL